MKTPLKTMRKFALAAAAATVLSGTVVAATASPALALERRYVCAQNVWVRSAPGGAAIAILYQGESFDYDHSATINGYQWAYGFAYGGENVWGWVSYSALTNSSGQC